MTRINIALTASEDWLKYSAITAASILKHAKQDDDYHFYIVCNKFSKKIKKIFYSLDNIKKAEYKFLTVDDSEFEGAIHDWLGVSASYRLKLSKLVDEDKILYLDSDIIAMQDISELYSKDISDYYLAAVEDKCNSMMKGRIGLNKEQTFFNSGLQLINLKMFRDENLEPIIFEKLRASTYYTDQDVINDVCRDKILSLPLKYNIVPNGLYFEREEERDNAFKHPVLLHFEKKPWKNPEVEFAKEWLQYQELLTKKDNANCQND